MGRRRFSKPDGTLWGDCLALLLARLRAGDAPDLTRLARALVEQQPEAWCISPGPRGGVARVEEIGQWFVTYEAAHGAAQRRALALALWRACFPPPRRVVLRDHPPGVKVAQGYLVQDPPPPPRRGRPRLQLATRWRQVLDHYGLGDAVHRQKGMTDAGSRLLQLFELQHQGPGRPRRQEPPTTT